MGMFHVRERPERREKMDGFASELMGEAALCPGKRPGLGPFPPFTAWELSPKGFALIK